MARGRKPNSEFRRAVGLTLPQTLVEALDGSLLKGESRSGRIEELVRDDLGRRGDQHGRLNRTTGTRSYEAVPQ